MARTRAAELARETTERELLDAALAVFVEKGYPAATIADIVQGAGVTQGTFYLYFENKAHIFSALLEEYRRLTIENLFDVDLDAVTTPADWLGLADRISAYLLDHLESHRGFLRLFIAETPTIGSGFRQQSHAYASTITAEIARILQHGIAQELLRPIDVEAVALLVYGALKEVVNQSCFREGFDPPRDLIPRVIRSQAQLLLR